MIDRCGLPYIFEFGGKSFKQKYIVNFGITDSQGRPLMMGMDPKSDFRTYDWPAATIRHYINDGKWIITRILQENDEPDFNMEELI